MASVWPASAWRSFLLQAPTLAQTGALAGCSSAPDTTNRIDIGSETSLETFATAYNLNSGDRIRITVFRHVDLSGEFVLNGRGNLAMPLIGEVRGSGQTLRELESQIEDAFKEGGFLVNPQVGVEVLSYRSFYILGKVNQPGSYAYVSSMTGIMAAAMGRGFTNCARQLNMIMQRGDKQIRQSMGLANVVLPGDILSIEERFF